MSAPGRATRIHFAIDAESRYTACRRHVGAPLVLSYDRGKVTCRRCLTRLERADRDEAFDVEWKAHIKRMHDQQWKALEEDPTSLLHRAQAKATDAPLAAELATFAPVHTAPRTVIVEGERLEPSVFEYPEGVWRCLNCGTKLRATEAVCRCSRGAR